MQNCYNVYNMHNLHNVYELIVTMIKNTTAILAMKTIRGYTDKTDEYNYWFTFLLTKRYFVMIPIKRSSQDVMPNTIGCILRHTFG